MKLILVATASLMTAGAAFGFARLADRLTEPAPIAAPQPIAAERVLRQRDIPQTMLPGPAPTAPAAPAEPVPTPPPTPALTSALAPAIATTAPNSASRDRVATAVPTFQPAFQNMNHFTPPTAGSGLDLQAPARRYEFETLPVIGAYR